ncbi:MAG TPA: hypothetical protein PKE27_08570 [Povalibacter sp.]|uniref:hypothetical protein n=1 Tax=Povalibacter sp. TaxID=1962978 RepID=UPI002C2FC802|nr:hypothetical protein [Povalibacter sp.]HMN44611.1 hypothetical protein [Povalibacter sp.]
MKGLLILILLGVGGYFGYKHYQERVEGAAPEVITDPVYAQMRMDAKIQGREFNFLLLGKMAGDEDCRLRSNQAWSDVINGCAECTKQAATCTATLEPRYQRLFDNVAIHSTYMSFEREAPRERDGRMVIYGLTADEGDFICEQLRAKFQNHYTGKVECVHARRD